MWIPHWSEWSKHIRFSGKGIRHRVKVNRSSVNPNVPLFSYYRGQRLPYERARKLMYIPWYAKLAQNTKAYRYLKKRFASGTSLILLDFDGQARDEEIIYFSRSNGEEKMRERINDPSKIFGHGFVLTCLLLDIDVWSNERFEANGA